VFYLNEQKNIIGMLFPGSKEYDSRLESIGTFVEKEILPDAKRTDQEEIFPRHNLDKLFRKGVMAIPFPQALGGLGLPCPVYIAALEMIARACAIPPCRWTFRTWSVRA